MKRALAVWMVLVATALACGQKAEVDVPAPSSGRYALVIGITGYKSLGDQGADLKYADRDAADFAAFIETTPGGSFPPDHVHLVTNISATRDRIFAEFRWLYETAGPGDLVYVFFAGHGAEFANDSYLLPVNVTSENMDSEGIPMSQFFRKATTDLSAKQVVVFIDACRSAAAANGARAAAGDFNVAEKWDQHNAKEGQLAMGVFSSLANQKSFEDPELGGGHGLFTWYLLEGLKGAAGRTREGWITAANVLEYVRSKVEARSQLKFHSRQTPIGTADFRTEFTLAFSNAPLPPSVGVSSFGLIQASSVTEGMILIDGKEMGAIFANAKKTFSRQAVGLHKVEFKGAKPEAIDVIVESGAVAEANFGIVNPIDKTGNVPTGELRFRAIQGMSGDLYIDNYRIGHLDVNGQMTISQLTIGAHTFKVIGVNDVTEGPVMVRAGQTESVTVAPAPPTNLKVTVQ